MISWIPNSVSCPSGFQLVYVDSTYNALDLPDRQSLWGKMRSHYGLTESQLHAVHDCQSVSYITWQSTSGWLCNFTGSNGNGNTNWRTRTGDNTYIRWWPESQTTFSINTSSRCAPTFLCASP